MNSEEYGYDAKFGVRTVFLDSTFYRRRQPKDGESFEDFVVEMHRDMLRAIERLQKEFPSTEIVATVDMRTNGNPPPTIDYKKVESWEAEIDNCTDSQQLEKWISDHPAIPGKLLSVINKRRNEFKNNQ